MDTNLLKCSFNFLALKKGSLIYKVGNWNGFANYAEGKSKTDTIDFSLTKWVVSASGKVQTYLTSPNGGTAKHKFYSTEEMYLINDTDFEEVKKIALACALDFLKINIEAEIESVEWYLSGGKYTEDSDFIKSKRARIVRMNTYPVRLLIFKKWYQADGESEISETLIARA